MKILIHSNAPFVPTGYGQQCAMLAGQLRGLGHDVAVSCFYGLAGHPVNWNGTELYPAGRADFGIDVLFGHAELHEADVVIFLMDFYKILPVAAMIREAPWKAVAWLPVDTADRIGAPDLQAVRISGAFPVAMSRHGRRLLGEAGFSDHETACIPHCIDTSVFRPDPLWEDNGRFTVGINAANMDAYRKGFPEQLQAFADFRKNHDDAVLLLHSQLASPRGMKLREILDDFGIAGAVQVTEQYAHTTGIMEPEHMAQWYNSLDVLSLCSYAEGFGIPLLEAQACGIPVITTRAGAMEELCCDGQLVGGDPFWNPVHRAYWTRPRTPEITAAYEKAYTHRGERSDKGPAFALSYDVRVTAAMWRNLLEAIA